MKKQLFKGFQRIKPFVLLLSILGVGFSQVQALGEPWIDVELGLVFTHYNRVQIPGDSGTRFNLASHFEQESAATARMRLGYDFLDRHTVSVLVAPLTLRYTGTLEKDTTFAGVIFPEDSSVEATYRFNSYRFTYRYELIQEKPWKVALGVTGKIRDAEVRLETPSLLSSKENVGFVPLIHLYTVFEPQKHLFFLLEADALAAPQGRAEDVLVAVGYKLWSDLSVRLGYRFLEGGSDSKEVYTFSYFHYTTVGIQYRF
ncbi:MAG: hypothetical protein N2442_10385 [Spirochaetes bacterium]|nr:hypothetical protein [Spirochaetota bacterium]